MSFFAGSSSVPVTTEGTEEEKLVSSTTTSTTTTSTTTSSTTAESSASDGEPTGTATGSTTSSATPSPTEKKQKPKDTYLLGIKTHYLSIPPLTFNQKQDSKTKCVLAATGPQS